MMRGSAIEDVARHVPALLFVSDARGSVEYVNDHWTGVIGASADDLTGIGWTTYVHPADLPGVLRDFDSTLRTGESYQGQWRLRHRDGAYRWIDVRAEPQLDENGVVVRWYGVGTDVDVQRRAMDALQLLAESTTTDAAADVNAVLEGVARAALAGLADVSLFDVLDFGGTSRRVVIAGDDVPQSSVDAIMAFSVPHDDGPHPIERALSESHPIHVPNVDEAYLSRAIADPQRRAAWRTIGIRSMIVAPMLVGGRPLGALTLVRTTSTRAFEASDVRVVVEVARRAAVTVENIRLTEAARRETLLRERQFRVIADSMPLLMWTARPDGTTEWHNRRWHEYTGQTPDEALNFAWAVMHPQDTAATRLAWDAAVREAAPYEIVNRLRRADGRYRWFLTRAIPERNESGTIVRWYGTTIDIDDARRAQRTLQVFSELGPALSASLEVHATLEAVMRVVVPEFADWAVIELVAESGDLRVATASGTQSPGEAIEAPLIVAGNIRGVLRAGMSDAEHRFGADDVAFFQELARRIAPAIANAELFERERLVASSFQNAALPADLPQLPACTFSAIYEAGRAEALVGGDWYDAFALPDGRIVLSMGDVAGSGLQAAVTMANMRQAIRAVAYVHPDPALMLEAADLALRSEAPERFVTAWVAILDPIENTISYNTAGHPPPLLRAPDGTIRALEAAGMPLGLREHDETESSATRIEPGSIIVLFTDGLVESTHDIDDGYQRLEQALRDPAILAGANLAAGIRDAVLTDGSHDDVAILCGRYTGVDVERRPVDVRDPAQSAAFAAVMVGELQRRGYAPDAVLRAEIVLAEIVGNLVRHAPGAATFVLDEQRGRVVLHVLDDGPGYRFSSRLPTDTFSERGRGLFLIAALAESFQVTLRPFGGSHLCVTFAPVTADDAQRTRWKKT